MVVARQILHTPNVFLASQNVAEVHTTPSELRDRFILLKKARKSLISAPNQAPKFIKIIKILQKNPKNDFFKNCSKVIPGHLQSSETRETV